MMLIGARALHHHQKNDSGYEVKFPVLTGPSPIPVPNVSVDEFSSLLTFMYTGYLDLNFTNIYNTLLATHILHMPRALELCRSFLVHNHPLDMRPAPIIKPIPSRKTATAHPQIFAPVHNANLPKSEVTPFRAVEKESSGSVAEKEPAAENAKVESKPKYVHTKKKSME